MDDYTDIEVSIQAVDIVAVTDAINETLRELAAVGAVDDSNDDGWAWWNIPGLNSR